MSVSLRFHPLQPKDNKIIKECLREMLKKNGESVDFKDSKHRKKPYQLTIHEIDALSKCLAFRTISRTMCGSLMDELLDCYNLSELHLKSLELSSNSDNTSESDTDVSSMSSSSTSSVVRDSFVSFARSLRCKQYDSPLDV